LRNRPKINPGVLGLLVVFLFGICPTGFGDDGVVTVVYDGDTIKVKFDAGREDVIRLIGINCPEVEDQRESVRLQALMAKRFTFRSLYNKRVSLKYDWEKQDKYGRILAYVFVGEKFFNEFILQEGVAWVFLRYPFRNDYRQRFILASREARSKERGLWKPEPYPVVSTDELGFNIGQLVRVEFVCIACRERGKFIYLHSREEHFAALIPRESQPNFPNIQEMAARRVIVTGFLEEYEGQRQILLFLPQQLVAQQ
jgi:micrococcal nuclease